jgi:hypothetical protein
MSHNGLNAYLLNSSFVKYYHFRVLASLKRIKLASGLHGQWNRLTCFKVSLF